MKLIISSTSRPALSTIFISADARDTSQMLDELLIVNEGEESTRIPGITIRSSRWFSESTFLGVDDNKDLMYSLSRSERYVFTTIVITGLTLMGSIVTWLVG